MRGPICNHSHKARGAADHCCKAPEDVQLSGSESALEKTTVGIGLFTLTMFGDCISRTRMRTYRGAFDVERARNEAIARREGGLLDGWGLPEIMQKRKYAKRSPVLLSKSYEAGQLLSRTPLPLSYAATLLGGLVETTEW